MVKHIENRTNLLMDSLNIFYKQNPVYLSILKVIIEERHVLSLRIIDWFVTNYTKKNIILLNIDGNVVDVYQYYKLLLKSYSKEYFDVFRRKEKILYEYKGLNSENTADNDTEDVLKTSCGQLCFFKWCFETNILDYIEEHLEVIEKDMRLSDNKKKRIDKPENMKKRTTLSQSASRSMSKRSIKCKRTVLS